MNEPRRSHGTDDLVLEALPIGVCVYDLSGALQMVTEKFCHSLKLPRLALRQGMSFLDAMRVMAFHGVFGPGDPEEQARGVAVLPDAEPRLVRRRLPGGSTFEMQLGRLSDGRIVASVVDQSRHFGSNDRSEAKVRQLSNIIQALPQGIAVIDHNHVLLFQNTRLAELLGLPAESLQPGTRLDRLPLPLTAEGEQITSKLLSLLSPRAAPPVRYELPSGQCLEVSAGRHGELGWVLTASDIGRHVQEGAVLKRHRQVLLAALDALPWGVSIYGSDQRLRVFNESYVRLTGEPSPQIGDIFSAGSLHLPENEAQWPPSGSRVRRTVPECQQHETALELHFSRLPDAGLACITVDVTARSSGRPVATSTVLPPDAEGARAPAAGDTAKSRFLTLMSHELRTPLNAIIGFSEALESEFNQIELDRRDGPASRVVEFAGTINKAGHDLLLLVNMILDATQINTGRIDLSSTPVDLYRLVSSCLKAAASAAAEARVALKSHLPPGLPLLHGDERRLLQVLSHVLGNAVKFTEPGGEVRISASMLEDGDLSLLVADTGIGIPAAEREEVFKPFVQLDHGTARRARGSGLGLYLARALAEAHGGSLSILSSEPVGPSRTGTTFVLRLPRMRLKTPTIEPSDGPETQDRYSEACSAIPVHGSA